MNRSLVLALLVLAATGCTPLLLNGQVFRSREGFTSAPQFVMLHMRVQGLGRMTLHIRADALPNAPAAHVSFYRETLGQPCNRVDLMSDGTPIPHTSVVRDGDAQEERLSTNIAAGPFQALALGNDVKVRVCGEIYRLTEPQTDTLRRFYEVAWRGMHATTGRPLTGDEEERAILNEQQQEGMALRNLANGPSGSESTVLTPLGEPHVVPLRTDAPLLTLPGRWYARYRVTVRTSPDAYVPGGADVVVSIEQPEGAHDIRLRPVDPRHTVFRSQDIALPHHGRIVVKIVANPRADDTPASGSAQIVVESDETVQAAAQHGGDTDANRAFCPICDASRRECTRTGNATTCRDAYVACVGSYGLTEGDCH